jgi:hypothetical protein
LCTAKLLGDFNVNRQLPIKAHRTGLSNLLWANAKGAPNHPASLSKAHPTRKKIRETLTIKGAQV